MSDTAEAPVAMNPVCKRTGCRKRINDIAHAEGDPYCTTECCKKDHGVYVESTTERNKRERAEAEITPWD